MFVRSAWTSLLAQACELALARTPLSKLALKVGSFLPLPKSVPRVNKDKLRLLLVKCYDNKKVKSPYNCVIYPLT